jgi:cellulose synthase/poly-beta-1,6-N-acetylglucosamine synthase-like glycosyltransferase
MRVLGAFLVLIPAALLLYAYLGYPAIMALAARFRNRGLPTGDPAEWPDITITLPVYNEERIIGPTIDSLLATDYPPERRHVLVVSDASTDRTDEIVGRYADRGVQLLRLPARSGKTAAENAASAQVHHSIIVNTDASTRIIPGSLKALVRVFQDPVIGLASGRDVSVGDVKREGNYAESGYVGYEMWLRSLETRAGSIVGASGCFYALRRGLFDVLFPAALSRDFAAALIATERGFRAVSVHDAVCLVPRTQSLRAEYRRKVRTMARGLETLWYKRHLLSLKRPLFGFELLSHKLIRWVVFLVAPLGPIGLMLLAPDVLWARWALAAGFLGLLMAGAALALPEGRKLPWPLAVAGFVAISLVAGFFAWIKVLRGELSPTWEPTRRG